MPGRLDVSLILKALDQGFSAEVRGSQQELRGLGQAARTTSGQMALQTAAMGRAAVGARNLRGAMGQLGFQVQDVAIQLAAGVAPISVLAIQGGQLLSALNPVGAAIGTVVTVAGLLAAALWRSTDAAGAAEEAQRRLDDTLINAGDTVSDLADLYLKLNDAQRGLAVLQTEGEIRGLTDQLRGQRDVALDLADKLEMVTAVRVKLHESLGGREFFAPVTPEQRAAVADLIAGLRDGQIEASAAAAEMDKLAKATGNEDIRALADLMRGSARATEDLKVQIDVARQALELFRDTTGGTARGLNDAFRLIDQFEQGQKDASREAERQAREAERRRAEIGRALTAQAREEERSVAEALRPRLALIEKITQATSDLAVEQQRTALVGVEGGDRIIDQLERENALRADGIDLSSGLAQKYLGIASALDRQRDATKDLQDQTRETEAALRSAERGGVSFARGLGGGLLDATRAGEGLVGTLASIGERLTDLITSKLLDIFAQQAGAPLGSFFGSLFGGSTAATGGGGTNTMQAQMLHAGGIVGQIGAQRQVPAALFAGAPRMHGGGTVLRAGEVPIIAQRGERVIPAGQAAAPQTVVIVNNQTGGQVETRQRRGPRGEDIREIFIREASNGMMRGAFDLPMASRFGLRPGRPG